MYEIDIILLLLSIVVSFVFYRRYSLSNDTTLLYWSLGFGFYSFSLLLSLLLVMGFFKSSFDFFPGVFFPYIFAITYYSFYLIVIFIY